MKKGISKYLVIGAIICVFGITTAFAADTIKSFVLTSSKVYMNGQNIPMSNPLASVVKNDDSSTLTYAPIRELFENIGYNVEWDGSDKSVHLAPKIISGFDELYSQTFPLVAAVYEEDAYLYAMGWAQGVLSYKGVTKAFDWRCVAPRLVMPRMQVFDYDSNGEKEVAVSIYAESGTGLSKDELHIITLIINDEINFNNDLLDRQFMAEDYTAQIAKEISCTIAPKEGKMLADISIGNNNVSIDITDFAKESSATESDIELAYGSFVEFTPMENGEIEMKVRLGVRIKGRIEPTYIACLKAEVSYDNGKFELSNMNISSDKVDDTVASKMFLDGLTTEQKQNVTSFLEGFDGIERDYITLLLRGLFTGDIALADEVTTDYNEGVFFQNYAYCLHDIDGNGFPEFILKTGAAEADSWITVYTITGDKLVECGSFGGSHATLYVGDSDGFVCYKGHMGVYDIDVSKLVGTSLVTHEIANGELKVNEEYPDLDELGYGNYNKYVEYTGIGTLFVNTPQG